MNEVTKLTNQAMWVRQGCGLSPYLSNLFIYDNTHALVVGDVMVPVLMYADDVTTASFTVQCLQKAVNQADEYCNDLGPKVNVNKTNIVVFRKGGRLNKSECWTVWG
jgi:hypothetical protein